MSSHENSQFLIESLPVSQKKLYRYRCKCTKEKKRGK